MAPLPWARIVITRRSGPHVVSQSMGSGSILIRSRNQEFGPFSGRYRLSDCGGASVGSRSLSRRPGRESRPRLGTVFVPPKGPVDLRDSTQWWRWIPGACWRHPLGPRSTIDRLAHHPVVHLALEDVEAFCRWSRTTLPTEAEWEFAARGGLEGAMFSWGDEDPQETAPLANTWQGRFPWENIRTDNWVRTSPVGTYPPNGYGLLDMAGNVWEWTADWYASRDDHDDSFSCCVPRNPRGGALDQSYDPRQPQVRIPRKVVKGGSHLCAPAYCYRYRPAARQPQMIDTGMCHLGFRRIVRPDPCTGCDIAYVDGRQVPSGSTSLFVTMAVGRLLFFFYAVHISRDVCRLRQHVPQTTAQSLHFAEVDFVGHDLPSRECDGKREHGLQIWPRSAKSLLVIAIDQIRCSRSIAPETIADWTAAAPSVLVCIANRPGIVRSVGGVSSVTVYAERSSALSRDVGDANGVAFLQKASFARCSRVYHRTVA